jgi:hypothetical protein
MRKILVMTTMAAMVSGSVAFGDPDVGCGWGTMAFKGQNGVAAKVLAATTNGILGDQTFGISSGTLGCHQGGTVTAAARLNMYAGANIDRLASDMAAGEGESLDTLVTALCKTGALRRDSPRVPPEFRVTSSQNNDVGRWAGPQPPVQNDSNDTPVALDVNAADQVSEARGWSVRFSPSGCSPLRPFLRRQALKRQHAKRRGELQRSPRATCPGSIRTRSTVPPPTLLLLVNYYTIGRLHHQGLSGRLWYERPPLAA